MYSFVYCDDDALLWHTALVDLYAKTCTLCLNLNSHDASQKHLQCNTCGNPKKLSLLPKFIHFIRSFICRNVNFSFLRKINIILHKVEVIMTSLKWLIVGCTCMCWKCFHVVPPEAEEMYWSMKNICIIWKQNHSKILLFVFNASARPLANLWMIFDK